MFYIFHGEDEFGQSEELAGLRDRLVRDDPAMAELNTTILDGKGLTILGERGGLLFDILLRALLVGAFVVIAPFVHVETGRRLWTVGGTAARRWRPRS